MNDRRLSEIKCYSTIRNVAGREGKGRHCHTGVVAQAVLLGGQRLKEYLTIKERRSSLRQNKKVAPF